MKIFTEHSQLLAQYHKQKLLEWHSRPRSSESPSQLMFEVSSTGIVWKKRQKEQSSSCQWAAANSYDQALVLVASKIQKSKLQPGSSVILHLWPPTIKIFSMLVGPGQRCSSALLLDELVQINPESLQLDPSLSYRAVNTGAKKVDVIGVGAQGWEAVTAAIPAGVKVMRMLGALSALDILLEKVIDEIQDPSLVCIQEPHRLHYIGLRKGAISGFRVVARNSLRDATDLKNTLNSMQIDPPSVLFVGLTSDSSDAEAICQGESEHNDIETSMTDRKSLLQEYPELTSCEEAIQLPLGMMKNTGQSKNQPLLFYTRQESQVIPLTKMEMSTIRAAKLFSTFSYILSLLLILLGAGFLFHNMQSTSWNVNPLTVQRLEGQWKQFNSDKQIYGRMVNQIENTPRIDRLTSLFCTPAPEGIKLETITFTASSVPSEIVGTTYQIEGAAISKNGDISFIKKFVSLLVNKFTLEFPSRISTGEVTSTSMDSSSMSTRFNFSLTVR